MMASEMRFCVEMTQDLEELKTLFRGEKELKAIEALPKEAYVLPSSNQRYFGRWQVAWIVVFAPFKMIASLVATTLSALTYCLCCRGCSRYFSILASSYERDLMTLFSQFGYGSRFLCPASSKHQIGTSDVYRNREMRKADIPSRELREAIFPEWETLQFYNWDGNCRGGCYWFNHLFVEASKRRWASENCNTYSELAKAVALQFKEGTPRQAALLQTFGGAEELLLPCLHPHRLHCFTEKEFLKEESKYRKVFETLENGVYLLGIERHAITYMKFGDEHILFDPSFGLFTARDQDELFDEFKQYLKGHKENIEIWCHGTV